MAEKQAKVVITGTHKRPGISHIEETRSEALGRYRFENGIHILEYEEYLEQGGPESGKENPNGDWNGGIATYNLVEISPSDMRVSRSGSVESVLHFTQGKEHISEYKTPYGAMKSRIVTTRYAMYQLEKGNRLVAEAEYTVSMNGMEMSETTMRIDASLS